MLRRNNGRRLLSERDLLLQPDKLLLPRGGLLSEWYVLPTAL